MTGKTKALRKLISSELSSVQGGTYHKKAPADCAYPYKSYRLSSVSFPNADRDDLILEVDIWDRNATDDPKTAEDIADQIEEIFDGAILPQPPLYPAFFREGRNTLEDPDKSLQHIQLSFSVQLHEKEE